MDQQSRQKQIYGPGGAEPDTPASTPTKRTSPQIERLSGLDAAKVAELEQQCFPQAWSEDQFRRALHNSHFLILGSRTASAELLGYISFFQTLDELEIINIAVHPKARRRGVGQALLLAAAAEGKKRGAMRILLEVRRSNKAAIALYQKCGFLQIGLRKAYYPDNNEDALLFELQLTTGQKS